jgi:hypothetical protein
MSRDVAQLQLTLVPAPVSTAAPSTDSAAPSTARKWLASGIRASAGVCVMALF